ncbi:MAG: HNH endonuclease, partial [Candidatus Bathyarchaeia archaeon]
CKNCGEEFFIEKWRLEGAEREKKNRGIFCSNECRQEYQKGENHPSYKGTYDYNEREEFRKTEEWEKIRNAVLERDGWKCWLCGDTGILNVHHIKNWKDYPDLRLDPSNLVTLCIACHKLMHKGKDFWKAMGLKENTEPTLKMPDIDWDLVEEKDEENNKISLESEPEVIENYNSFKTISEGEEKSGRVLSEKNRNLIKNSILQMKAAIAALEELLSATEPQGGEDEEKSKQRSKDVESDKQAFQDWLAMRQILRSAVNSISSSLETLNYKIRERSK